MLSPTIIISLIVFLLKELIRTKIPWKATLQVQSFCFCSFWTALALKQAATAISQKCWACDLRTNAAMAVTQHLIRILSKCEELVNMFKKLCTCSKILCRAAYYVNLHNKLAFREFYLWCITQFIGSLAFPHSPHIYIGFITKAEENILHGLMKGSFARCHADHLWAT